MTPRCTTKGLARILKELFSRNAEDFTIDENYKEN
jgi:hypothetical protein